MGTRQNSLRDTAEYQRGEAAEDRVTRILQGYGWYVIQSRYYCSPGNPKGPRMYGLSDAYILPDLDASWRGERRWFEVKDKAEVTHYRKEGGEPQHGIDLAHWRDYHRVEEITGNPVFIVVCEDKSGAIYYALQTALMADPHYREVEDCNYGHKGMAYWPRAAMRRWESVFDRRDSCSPPPPSQQ